MTIPGKLHVQGDGRITGPAAITVNHPFPCVNGRLGVTGAMAGVLMHTMVTSLPRCIELFNDPDVQASAHFGIGFDGRIHQFGPLGKGFEAWHAMAANLTWYGIEHEDGGDQRKPLTERQMIASAQLVELLSRFAGFPLQVTDDIDGRGYGTHVMGGAAWGGHTCPGPGPRAQQRYPIVAMARQIRAGGVQPAAPRHAEETIVTGGHFPLAAIAADRRTTAPHILRLTVDHFGGFPPEVAAYLTAVFKGTADPVEPLPAGMHLRVPVAGS